MSRPGGPPRDPDDATAVFARIEPESDAPFGAPPFQVHLHVPRWFPDEYRGVLLLIVAVAAKLILADGQPGFAAGRLYPWSMAAWAGCLLALGAAIFARQAKGLQRTALGLQLTGTLVLVGLYSVYWVQVIARHGG